MYKLLNDVSIYDKDEIDTRFTPVETAIPVIAEDAAEAKEVAENIAATANAAYDYGKAAKDKVDTYDTIITDITNNTVTAVSVAMQAKQTAEGIDAKATAAYSKATEAIEIAKQHVTYVDSLPVTIVDRIFGVNGDYYIGDSVKGTWTKLQNAADLPAILAAYTPLTMLGQAEGVATLDANGKIPMSQFPTNATLFIDNWDASTGVYPPSTDITPGDFYIVDVAGTIDGIKFNVNDRIMWNGTAWVKQETTEGVTSVNGQTGDVTIILPEPETDNVKFTAQALDETAKAQARENIGAGVGNGTVTSVSVKMNGSIVGTVTDDGVIDLGEIITEDIGCVRVTGDQTIRGNKTFNDTTVIKGALVLPTSAPTTYTVGTIWLNI